MIKIILKNRDKDYQNALQIQDLDDLVKRRNPPCKLFAKQSVTNACLHFELNNKLHTMKTRNTNQYNIEQCHTHICILYSPGPVLAVLAHIMGIWCHPLKNGLIQHTSKINLVFYLRSRRNFFPLITSLHDVSIKKIF